MQTTGNLITTGYWASPAIIPGWVLSHWVGTAVVTEPDISWDLLDSEGRRLPAPVGTRIYATKFELFDNLSAPNGYALKLGGSATDTNAPVVSTAIAASGLISKGIFRNALSTPFSVTTAMTFGLYLHNSNAAPSAGQFAQASQTTPINTLSPASSRPKPVQIYAEIWWARPDDGSLASMDITLCKEHQRLMAGVQ
jgi:hypothetical protein